jgi:two-component sensor histidine kinase
MRKQLVNILIVIIVGGIAVGLHYLLFSKSPGLSSAGGVFNKDTALVNDYIDQARKLLPEPGFQQKDIPEVIALAEKAEKKSAHAGYQLGLAQSYFLKGNALRMAEQIDSARIYFHEAIKIYKVLKNYRLLSETYGRLALSYHVETGINERIKYYEEAIRNCELSGEKLDQAHVLVTVGELCMLNNDYLKAQRLLDNALTIYQSVGFEKKHFVYDLLNQVNVGLCDYNKALNFGQMAVRTAFKTHDTSGILCTFYNRRGLPQLYLGQYTDAINSFDSSLIIAERYKDTTSIMIVVKNLAHAYIKAGKFDDCLALLLPIKTSGFHLSRPEANSIDFFVLSAYNGKKDGVHAEKYYNKLLASIPENSDSPYELYAYLEMIRYKIHFKKYREARKLINKAEAIYANHKLYSALKDAYRLNYLVDSSEGKLYSAVASYKKYKDISDSIFTMQREQQVKNLEKQFSSEVALREELKEQRITLLRTQGKLQASELRQSGTKNYLLFAGLILMAIFMSIGIKVYLLKQKNNLLLQKQKGEIDQQNVSLKRLIDQQVKLITEKEWLVREVHHRVKNNLQIIVSLLNFQSKSLHDETAINAIKNCQNRVKTMSFIHQRLYQSETLKSINIENYVRELVQYLRDALHFETRIEFMQQVKSVMLDVAQVIPIGLILNEAITNAIKYAFPGRPTGKITISFDYYADDQFILNIADNGIGLPAGFDWENCNTLGSNLIQSMAEQLDASFIVKNKIGMELTFIFKCEFTIEEKR